MKRKTIKGLERDLVAMEDSINSLAHDLRLPLSNIISFSDLLLEEDLSLETMREYINIIRGQAVKAKNKMDALLKLQKMDQGQVYLNLEQKTALDAFEQINKIFLEIKKNEQTLNVVFENPKDDSIDLGVRDKVVLVDTELSVSVITNLLKNAIEASNSYEKIIVNIFEDNNHFCISISNSGEVPEDFRKNLFRKFSTSKKDGTGIGLYSAKLIAEAHKGTITYEPFPGGTRFTVRIPLQICS